MKKKFRDVLITLACFCMLFSLLPAAAADTAAPAAYLRYDNDTQRLLRRDDGGNYIEDPSYTAVFNGSGAHFDEAGYSSAHSMRFSDLTTGLVFKAADGKSFNNGGDGITISYWINQTRTTYSSSPTSALRPAVLDNYEQLISTHSKKGDSIALCTDGAYYFVGGDYNNRWYEYSKDFLASGATNNAFVYTKTWALAVAVIRNDNVTVYKDGKKQYEYKGTSALLKSAGAGPTPTIRDFCSGLHEGLTEVNGTFTFRGCFNPNRNTDSIRIDRISLYDHALSAAEVTALTAAEQASALRVTCDWGDGIHSEVKTCPVGTAPALPEVSREGYDLKGWALDAEGKNAYTGTPLTADTTLYAQWTPREYALRLETNGGELPADAVKTYTPDSETVLPTPTRAGYDFTGWYRTAELINTVTKTLPHETGERTFYAGWKPTEYRVTYELDGGVNHTSNPDVLTLEAGTVDLEAPVKLGAVFGGWYASADRSGSEVRTLTAGADTVLYARWLSADGEETTAQAAPSTAGAETEAGSGKGCSSALACGSVLLAVCAAAWLSRKKKGVRVLSFILAVLLLLPAGSFIAAAGEEETGENAYEAVREEEEIPKRTVYILSIGNSYAVDQQTYVHQLAQAAGADLVVGTAYVGFCNFRKHLEQWEDKSAVYTYYENGASKATKQTLEAILKRQKWDYVTFTNATEYENGLTPSEPYLAELVGIVHQLLPKAQLVFNLTWADAATSTRDVFRDAYGKSQEANWEHNVNDARESARICDMPYVTVCGLAMRYAYEQYGPRMHRDGYHSSEMGRYMHACLWFEFFTGLPVPEDYVPAGGSYSGGVAPKADELALLREYARRALEDYQAAGGKCPSLLMPTKHETLSIRLTGTPKTEYSAGETFDYTSFEVTAVTAEGEKVVSGFTLDHTAPLTAADTAVAVTYDGLTVTVPVTVR